VPGLTQLAKAIWGRRFSYLHRELDWSGLTGPYCMGRRDWIIVQSCQRNIHATRQCHRLDQLASTINGDDRKASVNFRPGPSGERLISPGSAAAAPSLWRQARTVCVGWSCSGAAFCAMRRSKREARGVEAGAVGFALTVGAARLMMKTSNKVRAGVAVGGKAPSSVPLLPLVVFPSLLRCIASLIPPLFPGPLTLPSRPHGLASQPYGDNITGDFRCHWS